MSVCGCSSQEPTESTLSHLFIRVCWKRKPLHRAWAVLSAFWLSQPASLFTFLHHVCLVYLFPFSTSVSKYLTERDTHTQFVSLSTQATLFIPPVYSIFLVNRLWVFIFAVEWKWQLIKEPPKNHSFLESENAPNVLWIRINNAVADGLSMANSSMNNTVNCEMWFSFCNLQVLSTLITFLQCHAARWWRVH